MTDHTNTNRRDDLVEWLRDWLTVCSDGEIVVEPICEEIADHIEALQNEVDRLREALEWYVAEDAKYMRAALGEKQ